MKNSPARRVAITGMLFALAIALSFVESMIGPLLGLPPGVKLGLANIVVMYALLFTSRRQAFTLVVLKAAFGLLTRGPTAGFMSLCGGMLSFIVMVLLLLPKHKPSILLVSVAGALGHNFGQLLGIQLILGSATLAYAPVLLVSGVVFGVVTSLSLRVILPALKKTGVTDFEDFEQKQNKADGD